ncbi:MAG: beta-lactamase family protein [Aquisalinus sp.]|nr:beta-lactamase family protein [Aquisalinus sp.]
MRAIFVVTGLIVAGFVGWNVIGPDWRALLSNPPRSTDVLFWSQGQRDAGFRLLDQVPLVSKSHTIHAGNSVRALEAGAPLNLSLDIDQYVEEQNIAGLVILQDGAVRLEKYGLGFSAEERWTSFSVAKSLTSTLVGAAIQDGYIASLEDKVSTYITGLTGSAYEDVSIRQLLTMTSGVQWNEDYEDPASDVALFNKHAADDGLPNIVSYMKKLPRAHPPGAVWNYSTGETNLIGILVAEATGQSVASYLSEKIWEPYGMQQDATWLLGEDGLELSGCCIQAATRDFARFGQFILEGGQINGVPVLPAGWINSASTKQADFGAEGEGYGFQWWAEDGGQFAAYGIFGQSIYIDPSRKLVIAANSSWSSAIGYKDGENDQRAAFFKSVQEAIDEENPYID